MNPGIAFRAARVGPWLSLALALCIVARTAPLRATEIVISIKAQTMTLLDGRTRKAEFPISTSKFGLGDRFRSFRTPTGAFVIDRKIGDRLPAGAVFKRLHFTGEIVAPNSPGRDPIVTRVLCLRGLRSENRNVAARGIYIHGTPEEKSVGRPASYGCIRMRSRDVIALFDAVPLGTPVTITDLPPSHLLATTGPKSDLHDENWYR